MKKFLQVILFLYLETSEAGFLDLKLSLENLTNSICIMFYENWIYSVIIIFWQYTFQSLVTASVILNAWCKISLDLKVFSGIFQLPSRRLVHLWL